MGSLAIIQKMTLSEKEKLTVFRICIANGILDLSLVEKWAESIALNSVPTRTDYMLELCSAQRIGINETLHILGQNEDGYDNPILWQILYGFAWVLYDRKVIDLKQGCYFVSEIALEMQNKTEYELFGMSLDDSFYLASRGTSGNLEDTKEEFIKITSIHKDKATEFVEDTFKEIENSFS
jgi:hypothetical protein